MIFQIEEKDIGRSEGVACERKKKDSKKNELINSLRVTSDVDGLAGGVYVWGL